MLRIEAAVGSYHIFLREGRFYVQDRRVEKQKVHAPFKGVVLDAVSAKGS